MNRPKAHTGVPRYRERFRLLHEPSDDMRARLLANGLSAEQLESLVPSSPLPIDHPVFHSAASLGNPIARLLLSPSAVLEEHDSTRWPTAHQLNDGAAQFSAIWMDWLETRATEMGGAWTNPDSPKAILLKAVQGWPAPYPIGRACLEWDNEPFDELRELMPFDEKRHAAAILPEMAGKEKHVWFILTELVPASTIVVNRPVRPGVEAKGEFIDLPYQWAYCGKLARTVNGVARARCRPTPWVRWLAGTTVRDGRARKGRWGSDGRIWTIERFMDELFAYRDAHGPQPPKQITFLQHLFPDLSTDASRFNKWRRLSKDWDISWVEAVAWVYGPQNTEKTATPHG